MMNSITYGGVELMQYLRPTRGLDRGILPEVDHRLQKIGRQDGEKYLGSTYGKKVIPMPFVITNDLIEKREELARILSKRKEMKLIFGDEPDKYWNAIPTGAISVDEIVFLGKGVINWIIPDGVAHDVAPNVYTNVTTTGADNNLVYDSNYDKKLKYCKLWSQLLNEEYNGSRVVRGDFSNLEDSTADSGQYTLDVEGIRYHFVQYVELMARSLPTLKPGDKISANVQVRPLTNAHGPKSTIVIVQGLEASGGGVLENHIVYAAETTEVFKDVPVTATIQNIKTKFVRLIYGVSEGTSSEFTKPQFNVGAALKPYEVAINTNTSSVVVENKGSAKAWPILRATMNGENGMVSFINAKGGVLQFGNPDEVDGVQGRRTERVFNDNLTTQGISKLTLNDTRAKPAYPNHLGNAATPNIIAGSFDWVTNPETVAPVFVPNTKRVWSGPLLYGSFLANGQGKRNGDFIWRNRFYFSSTWWKLGRETFTLQNDNIPVLSAVVRDSSGSVDEMLIEFRYKLNVIHTQVLDAKDWGGRLLELTVSKSNGVNVEFKLSRFKAWSGDGITSSLDYIFTFTEPELENMDLTGLCYWATKFQDADASMMEWTDTKFDWVNETEILNIPNLFDDGDILEIDVKNRSMTLNGMTETRLQAIGNQWSSFAIEPGETTIFPVASPWAEMFDFEMEMRGAYY